MKLEYTGFEQQIWAGSRAVVPVIYDGLEDVPDGFNGARVVLDASDTAVLDWSESIGRAQEFVKNGLWVLWELDFRLLEGSLEDDSRFLTLQLGVQHFVEAVWPQFHEHTIGVCVYRGILSEHVRGEVIEYVKLLAALLPEEALPFLFLDTSSVTHLGEYLRLTSLEIFGHLKLALKGGFAERYPYALPALGWGHSSSPLGCCNDRLSRPLEQTRITHAICIPEQWDGALFTEAVLAMGETPFRVIPEALLTQEWDGIEKLIIFPSLMDARGWRKVKGFEAAAGEIIPFIKDNVRLGGSESSCG